MSAIAKTYWLHDPDWQPVEGRYTYVIKPDVEIVHLTGVSVVDGTECPVCNEASGTGGPSDLGGDQA